jgi:hypothetical protein
MRPWLMGVSSSGWLRRSRVLGLVEAELDPAGQGDGRQHPQPWSLIGLAISTPPGPGGQHGGCDVVGHEIELGPAAPLRGVDSDLGQWQRED